MRDGGDDRVQRGVPYGDVALQEGGAADAKGVEGRVHEGARDLLAHEGGERLPGDRERVRVQAARDGRARDEVGGAGDAQRRGGVEPHVGPHVGEVHRAAVVARAPSRGDEGEDVLPPEQQRVVEGDHPVEGGGVADGQRGHVRHHATRRVLERLQARREVHALEREGAVHHQVGSHLRVGQRDVQVLQHRVHPTDGEAGPDGQGGVDHEAVVDGVGGRRRRGGDQVRDALLVQGDGVRDDGIGRQGVGDLRGGEGGVGAHGLDRGGDVGDLADRERTPHRGVARDLRGGEGGGGAHGVDRGGDVGDVADGEGAVHRGVGRGERGAHEDVAEARVLDVHLHLVDQVRQGRAPHHDVALHVDGAGDAEGGCDLDRVRRGQEQRGPGAKGGHRGVGRQLDGVRGDVLGEHARPHQGARDGEGASDAEVGVGEHRAVHPQRVVDDGVLLDVAGRHRQGGDQGVRRDEGAHGGAVRGQLRHKGARGAQVARRDYVAPDRHAESHEDVFADGERLSEGGGGGEIGAGGEGGGPADRQGGVQRGVAPEDRGPVDGQRVVDAELRQSARRQRGVDREGGADGQRGRERRVGGAQGDRLGVRDGERPAHARALLEPRVSVRDVQGRLGDGRAPDAQPALVGEAHALARLVREDRDRVGPGLQDLQSGPGAVVRHHHALGDFEELLGEGGAGDDVGVYDQVPVEHEVAHDGESAGEQGAPLDAHGGLGEDVAAQGRGAERP